ncbi:squalene/phytoene synthase family protein [Seohaeicola saemankumensis]|uniref:squalene/phytoene synthase family protein n=1 Tax=Seohaeicola saemankumensis TaxID=481181 RepID=UPI001E4EE4A5|nr:squalene/phytoene synthase family protein [Seohaeicola saemankumensis]MCD1624496.1 squalene/phytoene synthase family protein [Seohaeicola saemankumensis]
MITEPDLVACARIVERGDPDRFAATMAAPVAMRQVLFPLYAFNLEIARAPWMSAEPLIAEMRLQWWSDALDEISSGGPVRRHEVATPLSQVLDATGANLLAGCVNARRREAQRLPMADADDLRDYVAETGGALMWVAARALGGTQETRARNIGAATGLANYLLGVPLFLARGSNPLPEMTTAQFTQLVQSHLGKARPSSGPRPALPQRIAELAGWRTVGILKRALRDPAAIPEGRLAEPEVQRRLSLMLRRVF